MASDLETPDRILPGYGVALVALAFLSILVMIAAPVVQEKVDQPRADDAPAIPPATLQVELVAG